MANDCSNTCKDISIQVCDPAPCPFVLEARCVSVATSDCIDEYASLQALIEAWCARLDSLEADILEAYIETVSAVLNDDTIELTFAGVNGAFNGNVNIDLSALNHDHVIDITHADLTTAVAGGTLRKGYFYRITDFATEYDRPDYEDLGAGIVPKGIIATPIGDLEPLIVLAIDTDTLHKQAWSETFPDDILYYELSYTTPVTSNATKGRIYFRWDTVRNIKADFDWREITFQRYDRAGDNNFAWYWEDDPINDQSAVYSPFVDLTNARNIDITGYVSRWTSSFDLPNFVFHNDVFDFYVPYVENSTFQGNVDAVYADRIEGSRIGFQGTALDTGISNCRFGLIFESQIGIDCEDNTFQNIESSTIGTGFIQNSFGLIQSTTIGDDFTVNDFTKIESSTFGNSTTNNNFTYIIGTPIGNTMNNNIFGSMISCNISNNFQLNTFNTLSGQNLAAATHVYSGAYSKEIVLDNTLGLRVKWHDNDVPTYAAVTA